MLSFPVLVAIPVASTGELISQAVRRFYQRHRAAAQIVRVSPQRKLACPKDFYPVVGCEDLGVFTVALECNDHLTGDTVECESISVGIKEVYYL